MYCTTMKATKKQLKRFKKARAEAQAKREAEAAEAEVAYVAIRADMDAGAKRAAKAYLDLGMAHETILKCLPRLTASDLENL